MKSLKKLLAIMTALVMTLALAACGGGSEGGGEAAASAEPNAGIDDIVFSVPDGWTADGARMDDYINFNTGSGFDVFIYTFDDEDLELNRQYSEEDTPESLQAKFEQDNNLTDEQLAEYKAERSTIQVAGTDAYYYKYSGDNGITGQDVAFLKGDKIYYVYNSNRDNYGDDGMIKSDAAALTDEEQATFESFVDSIQEGDGDALMANLMNADSVGSIAFEVPAGYKLKAFSEGGVELGKDGSDITISINTMNEEDLQWIEYEDGSHPESVATEYAERIQGLDAEDMITIAGYDGYKMIYPDENDKYYSVSAGLLADDVMYDIYMGSDAWDWDGNLKDDAEELTQDDLAVFEAFLASLKAK